MKHQLKFWQGFYISIVYHNYHNPEYIYFLRPGWISSFDSHVVTIEHQKFVITNTCTQPTYCKTVHCQKKA